MDNNINDPEFFAKAVERMLSLIKRGEPNKNRPPKTRYESEIQKRRQTPINFPVAASAKNSWRRSPKLVDSGRSDPFRFDSHQGRLGLVPKRVRHPVQL